MEISWARAGMRVQSHPATDAWLMGDRYGVIVKVGRTKIHVKMDRSGRILRFSASDIEEA